MMIRQWEPPIGFKFETNALVAIRSTEGNFAVSAGPGAGKSEMLAQRADFLFRTNSSKYPKRILSISFKVEAANNLRARIRDRCGVEQSYRFDAFTFHGFAKKIIDQFRRALKNPEMLSPDFEIGAHKKLPGMIRFEDLIPLALEIVRNSGLVRELMLRTYSDVFLDEFQDCTAEQYSLLKAIFHGSNARIVCVGDNKQTIMNFAGAVKGIFRIFVNEFRAKHLNLFLNHRALPVLRRMQNSMVKVMEPTAAVKDDDIMGSEGVISIVHSFSEVEESAAVISKIQQWISGGTDLGQIAIITANLPQQYAWRLALDLKAHDIPLRNEQLKQDFLTEPIVILLYSFLKVVYGFRQNEAYERLLSFFEGYGELSEQVLFYISKIRKIKSTQSIRVVLDSFIDYIGLEFIRTLSPEYQKGSFLELKISELLGEVPEDSKSLLDFLDVYGRDNCVKLLNVHRCKGLEFERVIVMGVETNAFFSSIEEARAAFFVAVSRAKVELVLTHCDHRTRPPGYTRQWSEQRLPHIEFLTYARIYI